jgi:hypothetical protein
VRAPSALAQALRSICSPLPTCDARIDGERCGEPVSTWGDFGCCPEHEDLIADAINAAARKDCAHEDDGGPFFAKCRKCGVDLDDYAGGN